MPPAHRAHPPDPGALAAREIADRWRWAVRRAALTQFFIDAARNACALERYRLANGALPDSLDALQPAFLEHLPNDVLDGKPLRYRRDSKGGYVLYSIGWNHTDDRGTVALRKKSQLAAEEPLLTEGDWVWEMPGRIEL